VAALDRIVLAPLRLGLDDSVVRSLAEALGVVAGVPVRDNARVGRILAVSEALHGALVIVVHVGEAHSSVGLEATRTSSLCGLPLPPTSASSICTKGPSGSLSERTIAARSNTPCH
jgi:hypothetical protein